LVARTFLLLTNNGTPEGDRLREISGLTKIDHKYWATDKLSAFQVVMLGRALRSQVANCAFEYDATKLVAELQRTAATINRQLDQGLRDLVLQHEAVIREAAESAWWDDLGQRASTRLVSVTAEHLRKQMDRGGVQARVVMSIDAIGPRTAATSIVSLDGRLLHSEDLPCQLSAALRSQAVARMGELIHMHHVDLLIVSNGPARRATMTAIGDLIAQSPENSIRWTLADRSGADAYASSPVADQEMRSTPRRFRAAAWLAFSILQPAQALAKVDPLKLRLSSFQRELSDEATFAALKDVMLSGASRGGVDVNSAPLAWLERLPGVSSEVAKAIDAARRQSLFDSRTALGELEAWEDTNHRRQALPFLRVFGSQEVLDGTLIHPEDYALASKLASSLQIELPPPAPPGYTAPDFSVAEQPSTELAETEKPSDKPEVEEFTGAGQQAREFDVDTAPPSDHTDAAAAVDAAAEDPAAADASPTEQEQQAAEQEQATDPTVTEPESSTAAAESGEQADQETTPEAESPSPDQADSAASDQGESAVDESAAASTDDEQTDATEAASGEQQSADKAQQSADKAQTKTIKPEIPEPILRPRPERSKIDKCVKEWQIGTRRAHQLVHWLCDPFGDSDSTGAPPAVLSSMPSAKSLKTGDQVIGVVVGVMPFGVFVELAPDCSGLIHVSRVSDSYVDDLHEAVQVGDVMTSWVTGIDEKRRRVALSAVSPEREAELEQAKRNRDDHSRRGGPRQRGGGDRGAGRGQARSTESRSTAPAGAAGGGTSGGQPGGGKEQSRSKDPRRGGHGRDAARGGRSRDARGGRGREKKPDSYRVVSKKEAKPISDAMQKGDEPLRSFGDLMQFFDKTKSPEPAAPQPEAPSSDPAPAEQASPQQAEAQQAADSSGKSSSSEAPAPPASNEAAATAPPSTDQPIESSDSSQPDSKSSDEASVQTQKSADESGSDPSEDQPSSREDASTQ
jgi:uncharacterized protein